MLVNVLPATSIAGSVGAELSVTDRVTVRLATLLTSSSSTALGRGSAETRLVAGRLDSCAGVPIRSFQLFGCAGAAAGVVIAKGDGFGTSLETRRPWMSATVRSALRFPRESPFSIQFGADGFLNVLRPRVHVMSEAGQELDAYTLPAGGGAVFFAVLLRVL